MNSRQLQDKLPTNYTIALHTLPAAFLTSKASGAGARTCKQDWGSKAVSGSWAATRIFSILHRANPCVLSQETSPNPRTQHSLLRHLFTIPNSLLKGPVRSRKWVLGWERTEPGTKVLPPFLSLQPPQLTTFLILKTCKPPSPRAEGAIPSC